MSYLGKKLFLYHIVLSTDVSGWEDVLKQLEGFAAEIWYHGDSPVPHYHVITRSYKLRNVSMVRKALGFFGGVRVEALDDLYAYRQALAYARSKGERYD